MARNIVQVRYNLGSVKVIIGDDIVTVDDLKRQLHEKHRIPLEDMCLTRDQRNTEPISCDGSTALTDAGIRPGMTVFLSGRYEKKTVEHAYVTNGVVTPAGEQIIKCPPEGAEAGDGLRLQPPTASSAPAAPSVPSAVATAANVSTAVPSADFGAPNRPESPPFIIPDELMDEQLSPEVRRPDKVKKMTLFGPDSDEDSEGDEREREVARLMEMNADAIDELRLAGLSEREIMEALSIDAKGRPGLGAPSSHFGYRREVHAQTRALLGGGGGGGRPAERAKRSTTTGMTGSERRRAAQRERLGLPAVSTDENPALKSTRPAGRPPAAADVSVGEVGNSWAGLDVEELISASKGDSDALGSEDVSEQRALMQQFEEEQKRRAEAARQNNEKTLDAIRGNKFHSLGDASSAPVEYIDLTGPPTEPPAGHSEGIDLTELGLDPSEVAAQKELMERFARMSVVPEPVRVPPAAAPSGLELEPSAGDGDDEEGLQRYLLEEYEKEKKKRDQQQLDNEKRKEKERERVEGREKERERVEGRGVTNDDSFDAAALGVDEAELAAQLALMKSFERRAAGGVAAASTARSPPPAAHGLMATGRTPEQLMSALGLVSGAAGADEYERFRRDQQDVFDRYCAPSGVSASSRGVLSRPRSDVSSSSVRSKVLADSAVEILSGGRKGHSTDSSRHPAYPRTKDKDRPSPQSRQVLGVSASRDDIQLASGSPPGALAAGGAPTRSVQRLAAGASARPHSSSRPDAASSRSTGPPSLGVRGARPQEKASVDAAIASPVSSAHSRPSDRKDRKPRGPVVEARPLPVQEVDRGLLMVGAAPVVAQRTHSKGSAVAGTDSRGSSKPAGSTAGSDTPGWLRAGAAAPSAALQSHDLVGGSTVGHTAEGRRSGGSSGSGSASRGNTSNTGGTRSSGTSRTSSVGSGGGRHAQSRHAPGAHSSGREQDDDDSNNSSRDYI